MSCKKYRELISIHLDNELDETEAKELKVHLQTCSECRQYAKALNDLVSRMSGWEDSEFPRGLERSILDRTRQPISQGKTAAQNLRGYYKVPRPLAWAATILIIFLLINTGAGLIFQDTLSHADKSAESAHSDKITIDGDDVVSYTVYNSITDLSGRIR